MGRLGKAVEEWLVPINILRNMIDQLMKYRMISVNMLEELILQSSNLDIAISIIQSIMDIQECNNMIQNIFSILTKRDPQYNSPRITNHV